MTTEYLLIPRYKICKEGYPDMPFVSEAVILLNGLDDNKPFYSTQNEKWYEPYFDRFPNIFRKLEWWERRSKKDLPEYIRAKESGRVVKAEKWDMYGLKETSARTNAEVSGFCWFVTGILPATEAEYIEYQQSL